MTQLFTHLVDVTQGKTTLRVTRSSQWPKVRKAHLQHWPTCLVCGGSAKLEVHHVKPFHLHPELELDPSNLMTLCEALKGGANCHLLFGHLGNYRSFNADARTDAEYWAVKLATKPEPA